MLACVALCCVVAAQWPVSAQSPDPPVNPLTGAQAKLVDGLAGALRGCELWVLEPTSWANGMEPFAAKVGLGASMALVDRVAEVTLPPPPMRVANHYWRINATPGAGYILIVSDKLPICHITGGGDADLQPVVEAALASEGFAKRWERIGDNETDGMISTIFRDREAPAFSITVSRATRPGQRLDRVQLLATAVYQLDK